MLRRSFLNGMFFAVLLSKTAHAQGVCKIDGPTADEIFADLLKGGDGSIKVFDILISRGDVTNFKGKRPDGSEVEMPGVAGEIFLNGSKIGNTVENDDLKIPIGEYPGYLRYVSRKNFVQGPMGTMANVGDFLLEIGNVDKRTAILLHGGTKPWHSEGCILLGAVKTEKDGSGKIVRRWVEETDVLRILRKSFYGTETPNACPNIAIRIKVA